MFLEPSLQYFLAHLCCLSPPQLLTDITRHMAVEVVGEVLVLSKLQKLAKSVTESSVFELDRLHLF
jgi:hypothetical protein